jgi:hypothetical protein
MRVRIKFSADVYIEGKDMSEVRDRFESIPLFSSDALLNGHAKFNELLLVEDAETYNDLMEEYQRS